MSLQDDVFDIEAALEGKPEAEQFQRVVSCLWANETERDELRSREATIRAGFYALMEILV